VTAKARWLSSYRDVWNAWRKENPSVKPDLSGNWKNLAVRQDPQPHLAVGRDTGPALLRRIDYLYKWFRRADFSNADLSETLLIDWNFRGANLTGANLSRALALGSDFSGADLSGADLSFAVFPEAKFRRACLRGASLLCSVFSDADLRGADLTGCYVYGVSAWGLKLSKNTKQQNLVIASPHQAGKNEPIITVDNIEVAQFVFLLLHNSKIRDVIDTITSKVVLILGRFTDERRAILDAMRDELRRRDYLPILFDFEKSTSRTTNETITLLARMARFVIADISDARSVLQELEGIVPHLSSVPVQPIIIAGQGEPGMLDSYRPYPWFLPVHRYDTPVQLLADLSDRVIGPAEAKVAELRAATVAPPLNPR
jgi:hypothetical protein